MTKRRIPGSPKAALEELFEQFTDQQGNNGVAAAADFLGRSKFHLLHATDPDGGRDLGFVAVSQLTSRTATAAVEHLCARAGGYFVPGEVASECIHSLLGRSSQEWGEFIAAALAALQDPRKIPSARKELNDVIRILVCLGAQLDQGAPLPAGQNVTTLRRGEVA